MEKIIFKKTIAKITSVVLHAILFVKLVKHSSNRHKNNSKKVFILSLFTKLFQGFQNFTLYKKSKSIFARASGYTFLLVLFFTICLGCKKEVDSNNKFKVGLIISGNKNDGSWSQLAYNGLLKIKNELNAAIYYHEDVSDTDAESYIEGLVQKDCNFIVAAGAQYNQSMEKAALKRPDINFGVLSNYPGNNNNLAGIAFETDKISFLLGYIAAIKTKTNKVGFILGGLYPHTKIQVEYFQKGLEFRNSSKNNTINNNRDIEFTLSNINSWTDKNKALAEAEILHRSGVDIIIINADSAGIPVFKYCEDNLINSISWNRNVFNYAPNTMLVYSVQAVDAALLESAKLVLAGQWEGKLYRYTMRQNAVRLGKFNKKFTKKELTEIDDLYYILKLQGVPGEY